MHLIYEYLRSKLKFTPVLVLITSRFRPYVLRLYGLNGSLEYSVISQEIVISVALTKTTGFSTFVSNSINSFLISLYHI